LNGEVHVWRAELGAPGWPGPRGLPAAERERAAAMRRPGAAGHWVAARWALRYVLARYLDEEPGAIELALDPQGKPRLADAPERLHFNLSHSGGLALVALCAELEVGVDLELVQPERDAVALAERGLPVEDAATVQTAPEAERAMVFHQYWADLEARLKCLGVGLGGTVQDGSPPVSVASLEIDAGYAAAVAVAAPELPPLRCWTFDPARQKAAEGFS
jgi:4'-phosphopantetheinyl transferase